MIRTFLRSSIRNATVTGASPSLRLDPVLLRAAELQPFEAVEVVHAEARFRTYVEAGDAGEVSIRGVRAGDAIEILSYGLLHDGQTLTHRVKLVTVDEANRVVSIAEAATDV
ncbi:MAG TPA: aspartate 1-decarboxylase [Thermoanaerobaculia bacterium]|nr:aspartate 1-decarboxylase [Thermoanaerobaculia bacterium]